MRRAFSFVVAAVHAHKCGQVRGTGKAFFTFSTLGDDLDAAEREDFQSFD